MLVPGRSESVLGRALVTLTWGWGNLTREASARKLPDTKMHKTTNTQSARHHAVSLSRDTHTHWVSLTHSYHNSKLPRVRGAAVSLARCGLSLGRVLSLRASLFRATMARPCSTPLTMTSCSRPTWKGLPEALRDALVTKKLADLGILGACPRSTVEQLGIGRRLRGRVQRLRHGRGRSLRWGRTYRYLWKLQVLWVSGSLPTPTATEPTSYRAAPTLQDDTHSGTPLLSPSTIPSACPITDNTSHDPTTSTAPVATRRKKAFKRADAAQRKNLVLGGAVRSLSTEISHQVQIQETGQRSGVFVKNEKSSLRWLKSL